MHVPPSGAPTAYPTIITAPALPMASVRWEGLVTSAMYARPTLATPDQKPSHARATNSHGTLCAVPVSRKPTETPNEDTMRTGRRPSLSEAYPDHVLAATLKSSRLPATDFAHLFGGQRGVINKGTGLYVAERLQQRINQ